VTPLFDLINRSSVFFNTLFYILLLCSNPRYPFCYNDLSMVKIIKCAQAWQNSTPQHIPEAYYVSEEEGIYRIEGVPN